MLLLSTDVSSMQHRSEMENLTAEVQKARVKKNRSSNRKKLWIGKAKKNVKDKWCNCANEVISILRRYSVVLCLKYIW